MLYENLVPENKLAFISKVKEIASLLGIEPDWLMLVMKHESGLNSRAYNNMGGATGLIQFMPATAISLGTTTVALYNMSNVEQLDWVYKYFKPYKRYLDSFESLFLVTFFPAALGKADTWVFRTGNMSPQTVVNYNKPFDLNRDGVLTVGEWKQYLRNYVAKSGVDLNQLKKKV
jgi:hypothetical protein